MNAPAPGLARIPVVDMTAAGSLRHQALESRARAQALRDDCLSWLPRATRATLPALDAVTRRWLERSRSPYVAEIVAIAETFDYPGIWFLNGCYQWGCTALAREHDDAPWLVRTLDWPFPGLGRYVEVARRTGPAGRFDSVTWPGFVGALTASAPGRFAAAINQAPLWRRTRHPWLRPGDMAINALSTWRIRFVPPDHLLRQVMETAGDYREARQLLERTPIARPVIYTLVGCAPGERCVIERTEERFVTRERDTGAANDWLPRRERWEARICSDYLLSRSSEEAAERSHARRVHLAEFDGSLGGGNFGWLTPPVLNPFTRIAVEMCPARAVLCAVGYEAAPGEELPQPVTLTCELRAAA
jgi:hypothetical protein